MMKNLDDIAKEKDIDSLDLDNAVNAVLASRKGSYFEADSYERGMSRKFKQAEWEVAHQIANVYEKRGNLESLDFMTPESFKNLYVSLVLSPIEIQEVEE